MEVCLTGTVTSFDAEQLLGFVRLDGWIKEILVPRNTLATAGYPELATGDRVKIHVARDDRYVLIATDLVHLPAR